MYRLYDLVLAMSIGWSLYGVLNILSAKNRKDINRSFALSLIICMTIPVLDHLIKPTPNVIRSMYPFMVITRNIYFVIGPLIWFYVASLISPKSITKKVIVLHSMPFLVWVIISLKFQHLVVKGGMQNPIGHINYLTIIRTVSSSVSATLYGIYSMILIINHKKNGLNFYTNRRMVHTLSWLSGLLLFMTISYSIFLLMQLLKFGLNIHVVKNPYQILTLTPIIFLFFFSYYSTKQSIPKDTESGFNSEKYKKSTINQDVIDKVYTQILTLVEGKKLYLNPNLTIEDISLELNRTKHSISQVINQKTDNNFYHFINNYRVKEFKLAVKENRFPLYTIVDIAFQCGFNSSSVFYSYFKKSENLTPKTYIDSITKK